ncbi:MAG: hypothetical protein IAE79_07620 [Anaerolinea sp.]|nr:hypothetical protein [Anaerolinea sp.]
MMRVMMWGVGNPDFGQSPFELVAPVEIVAVCDFAEASAACRAYIAEHELGGGNWRGEVFDNRVDLVATVSYNGRVWSPESGADSKLLYDPYRIVDQQELKDGVEEAVSLMDDCDVWGWLEEFGICAAGDYADPGAASGKLLNHLLADIGAANRVIYD